MDIVIDTETTGLDKSTDELLQVSILDMQGNVLYNSYIKPVNTTAWLSAEKINNITPNMVSNAPTAAAEAQKIISILCSAKKIIGYNVWFDLAFIGRLGWKPSKTQEVIDIMTEFAPIYGEYNYYFNDYKWQKLATCAHYYGYDGEWREHNSLEDCRITLYCYKHIIKDMCPHKMSVQTVRTKRPHKRGD